MVGFHRRRRDGGVGFCAFSPVSKIVLFYQYKIRYRLRSPLPVNSSAAGLSLFLFPFFDVINSAYGRRR
jgi:hypothetical protein